MTSRPDKEKPRHSGQSRQTNAAWTPKSRKAKRVGEFMPDLMRPAFEKFGFPAAAILTEWSAIAGPDLAAYTLPERLKWPRKDQGEENAGEQKGATLILRVGGAHALEVDHLRPRIIERINASFGYRAVSEIRIIQGPIPDKAVKRPPKVDISACNDPLLADLPDSPLKTALSRMSGGIRSQAERREADGVQPAFTGNS